MRVLCHPPMPSQQGRSSEIRKALAGIQGFSDSIQEWSSKIQYPTVSREDLVAQPNALMGQSS
jgi:hypothetical protein